jgi:hypothetical protein
MDMQARRDAFTLLTDEKPPENLKRWLVVWTDHAPSETWTAWAMYDSEDEAVTCAELGATDAQAHDLDNQ